MRTGPALAAVLLLVLGVYPMVCSKLVEKRQSPKIPSFDLRRTGLQWPLSTQKHQLCAAVHNLSILYYILSALIIYHHYAGKIRWTNATDTL